MSSVRDDILAERAPQVQGGAWHAIIASDPGDQDERIYITIPEFSNTLQWGPCRWQARSDTALPARGDTALAMRSNRGEWWVISWWPFDD